MCAYLARLPHQASFSRRTQTASSLRDDRSWARQDCVPWPLVLILGCSEEFPPGAAARSPGPGSDFDRVHSGRLLGKISREVGAGRGQNGLLRAAGGAQRSLSGYSRLAATRLRASGKRPARCPDRSGSVF